MTWTNDYDLQACLDENPQDGFDYSDIADVLAVVEGERDEDDWHWLLRLTDDRLVYLSGGCDYTGWDCRSNAHSVIVHTQGVLPEFLSQLRTGRNKTARESVGEDLGL